MASNEPFGRSLVTCSSAEQLLASERAAGKVSPLGDLDPVVERLVTAALQETVRTVSSFERGKETFVRVDSLTKAERKVTENLLTVAKLNERGAWFLPEDVSLRSGLVNLPSYFRSTPRFAHNLAADDRVRTALASTADAVLVWAILEPLFDLLLRPLELFGLRGGNTDKTVAAFDESTQFLRWAGLATDEVVQPLRSEPPQFGLDATTVLQKKFSFLNELHGHISKGIWWRFRAHLIKLLATQYYAKAKKDGRAKRKQVVTKALENEFVGAFLGDWPALVEYFGEELHADERIVTSLPEPTLQVATRSRVAEVAAARGLPIEEVERIAAGLWETGGQESPVHERVQAMSVYWGAFHEAHMRQEPGMASLWGLVDEASAHQFVRNDGETPQYNPFVYREHLSSALCETIERLWGSTVLSKFPDRVVSEPFPHTRMAEAFGPALKFWNGCGLTTWFFCEGPYSRTDLKSLQHYHRSDLSELEALGCPIHPDLFKELIAAERRLGPEEAVNQSSVDVGSGVRITMSFGHTRRRGFQILRDIVTKHRQQWAQQFLPSYLDQAWRTPLRDVAQRMSLETTERGKPPTLKQFAKHAAPVAATWFGGDVSLVYAAIGQKASFNVQRRRLMPRDVGTFVQAVHKDLELRIAALAPSAGPQQVPHYLAIQAPYCVQLIEALDGMPTAKDLGNGKLGWMAESLKTDANVVAETMVEAVTAVLRLDGDRNT